MRKFAVSKLLESDRIIGFTIPKGGVFYICDHDKVWHVTLDPIPSVQATSNIAYDFISTRTDFLGLVFKELRKNPPLLSVGGNKVSYDFDPKKDFVEVNFKVNNQSGQIEFQTLSGDWFATSFSDDGNHLVLADPYDLAVYKVC